MYYTIRAKLRQNKEKHILAIVCRYNLLIEESIEW